MFDVGLCLRLFSIGSGLVLLCACGDDGTSTDGGSTGEETETDPTFPTTETLPTGDDTTGSGPDPDTSGSTTGGATDATDGTTGAETTSTTGTDSDVTGTTGTTGTDSDDTGSTGTTTGNGGAVCGDGAVEGNEACDDGNTDDGDACSGDCMAVGDCVVPVTHADIQAALNTVACETVYVMPGAYVENLAVQRDVVVEPAAPGEVSVHGGGAAATVRIFVDNTVTLRGLTITGGSSEQGGGIANAGTLTVEDCEVSGNVATGASPRGGGIFSIAPVTLVSTSVTGNSVSGGADGGTQFGAGIYVSGADLTLTGDSSVTSNTVDITGFDDVLAGGGGIFLRNGTLTLGQGTSIDANQVLVDSASGAFDGYGGAGAGLYLRTATLLVESGVTITGNTVDVQGSDAGSIVAFGGGAYLLESDATFDGPITISDNEALTHTPSSLAAGGGIHADEVGTVSLTGVTVQDNRAASLGEVSGNAVLGRGGGIYAARNGGGVSSLAISQSTIHSNDIQTQNVTDGTAQGGGLFAVAFIGATVSISVDASTFSENTAGGQVLATGGGLQTFAEGDGAQVDVDLLNSTFVGNSATATDAARGGGLALGSGFGSADLDARVRNVTVQGNELTATTTTGRGIYVASSGAAVTALSIGGAVVHGNGTTDCASSGTAVLTSAAPNLWGDPSGCPGLDLTDAIVGTDPMLATLVDAGGPTMVLLPPAGSAVIDALAAAQCLDLDGDPLVVDQRGQTRPDATDCDLGAVERQAGDP